MNPAPKNTLFLNGLRGFAAFIVVESHTRYIMKSNQAAWPAGNAAVDIFFVLSSFLLTRGLYNKVLTNKNPFSVANLLDYFLRRFFRVYPLFFYFTCINYYLNLISKKHPDGVVSKFIDFFTSSEGTSFDFFQSLVFDKSQRFFVVWTLPYLQYLSISNF